MAYPCKALITEDRRYFYYVKPTEGSKCFENHTACEELEYYLDNSHLFSNLMSISFKFLSGKHIVGNQSQLSCSNELTYFPPEDAIELTGLGPAKNVTISSLCIMFTISGSMHITNITVVKSAIYIYKLHSGGHQPSMFVKFI